MRVRDGRDQQLVEVPRAGRALLRLRVHVACADGSVGWTDVRALLIGDVLCRAVETGGRQVMHDVARPALPPEQSAALDRVLAALAVHPPTGLSGSADADVYAGVRPQDEPGVRIEVGAVLPGDTPAPAELLTDGGVDPFAVRLALLAHQYRMTAPLRAEHTADAERQLSGWRSRVAEWARAPSGPVPDTFRRHAEDALADDLDTPGVLDVLRDVEAAPDVTAGAKFETFALLDRILALDLAREVGRD
ncbi:hypothetical protein ACWCP6_21400 [Streptomyces sp. NPDC002004]